MLFVPLKLRNERAAPLWVICVHYECKINMNKRFIADSDFLMLVIVFYWFTNYYDIYKQLATCFIIGWWSEKNIYCPSTKFCLFFTTIAIFLFTISSKKSGVEFIPREWIIFVELTFSHQRLNGRHGKYAWSTH